MLKSIRGKMIIIFSILVLILIGVSSSVLYNQASSIMQNSIHDSATNSAKQNANIIQNWLQGKINDVEILARTSEIKSMDLSQAMPILKGIVDLQEDIEDFNLVDLNGKLHRTTGATGNISTRDHFKETLSSKKTVVTKPLTSQINGDKIIVVETPIFDNNQQIVGVLGAIVRLNYLQKLVNEMKINGTGNGWIIDGDLNTVAHPQEKYLGNSKIYEDAAGLKEIAEKMVQGKNNFATYKLNGQSKQLAYAPIPITGWSIAMGAQTSDVLAELSSIRKVSLWVGIIGLLLGILITYFIASYIAAPINDATKLAETLAKGDFTRDVPRKFLARNDEIGRLGKAFKNMTVNLRGMIGQVREISEQVAASSEELSASGEQVGVAAQEVSSAIQNVASGAEEQSAQVEETRDNISSLIEQINEVGETSGEMNESADDVMTSIKEGNRFLTISIEKVNNVKQDSVETAENIHTLGKLSEEIGDIIELINGIAAQTNLLALNAAIEAARAGEAGRGFSVVAEEIRELAEESSNATDKIDRLIKEIQDSVRKAVGRMESSATVVGESVDAIEETGQSFTEINTASEKLLSLISDIASKAQQMSANSHEVRGAVDQIASVSQEAAGNAEEVAASSEEQNAATEEIISASNELSQMANQLSETVNQFKI